MTNSPVAVALPHFCHYLTQLPPRDYDSILNLCQWSLVYTDARGVNPFSKMSLSSEVQQSFLKDFPFRVQHIIVNALHREAWSRCWCQRMGAPIANETPRLSNVRYQQISPVEVAQQRDHYQRFVHRAEALKKMQQHKAQQENT